MKTKIIQLSLLLSICCLLFASVGNAQLPRVYNVENTGSGFPAPILPTLSNLPTIEPLTDPFMKSDNSSRSTLFSNWASRRNEIKHEIEHYEIGVKPPKPDTITATYTPGATPAANGTLRVFVTRNGQTITLTSQVSLPTTGTGPYPAVIGMNSLSGSVPATVFTNRNIARIQYNHNNVTTYNNPQLTDPFYRLYPEYNLVNAGQYSAWAWGVSRIIDGLELVQSTLPINVSRLAVTGCSYAGKMALFSGAFDERIALTIAQESGGGGAPAWRVSETLGGVEKLGATDYRWFRDSMRNFQSANVVKLPHDHHELMAMVAPRALLVTANVDFEWLANPSCYVSARAAHEVWKTFGIADRFGFTITGGHNHCAAPATVVPAMQAFVDKFLLDSNNVNTDTVRIHPYPQVDYARWFNWWGTGSASFDPKPGKRVWLEAECGKVGSQWLVSNESSPTSSVNAVQVKSGLSSPGIAPANDSSYLTLQFPVDSAGNYNLNTRINVPSGEDYSFWYKVNNGGFQLFNSNVIIPNQGFENGLAGWPTINNQNNAVISATTIPAEVRTGANALKIQNLVRFPGTQLRVRVSSIPFTTTKGKAYDISYWVKSTSVGATIRLSTGPNEFQYQPAQATDTTWKQITWRTTAYLDTTTFQFNVGSDSAIYYIDDISIKEVNGGFGWQWVGINKANFNKGINTLTISYANGGNTKIDKVVLTTNNSIISDAGLAGSNCNIQAVNIISFTGRINNNLVDLDWKTSNEINLNYYAVEWFNDNGVFVEVGKVNALNGLVNNSYVFGDTSIINVNRYQYYRLKLVDAYGQYYYSSTLKISPISPIELRVIPNPVRNTFVVQHDKATNDAQILLYNIQGKLLKTVQAISETVQTRMDVTTLPAGVYTIQFLNNGIKKAVTFTKI